ncbi:FxDxF family PEP-CTERM protein [Silvimonas iriomotensis]|uniref:Ice-binding protein C-terminal domain-containing protein n=1 Tax=Silvimonas iriomotensis TaxID=449662 RepID=A0ABQ2PBD9_9NEIS|nr:FxDxF family PEP-CTERM protein [Silvimonas iriomotensis]GGP22671.1 hypothetical protein GCM10010970_26710 [Silvimonas iriomotensis]
MQIRQLVAGVALALAATSAFAKQQPAPLQPLPATSSNEHVLDTIQAPNDFFISYNVGSMAFDDVIKFTVNPTSYAEEVYFSQFQVGPLHDIAWATLSLWDDTTHTFFGTVNINEPVFDAAEIFFSGHQYRLEVIGALTTGSRGGTYGLSGMLTPVPEPETWALLGLGMVSLVAARARARKRASGRLEAGVA